MSIHRRATNIITYKLFSGYSSKWRAVNTYNFDGIIIDFQFFRLLFAFESEINKIIFYFCAHFVSHSLCQPSFSRDWNSPMNSYLSIKFVWKSGFVRHCVTVWCSKECVIQWVNETHLWTKISRCHNLRQKTINNEVYCWWSPSIYLIFALVLIDMDDHETIFRSLSQHILQCLHKNDMCLTVFGVWL